MMYTKHMRQTAKNERGFASITIALVFVVVLALLSVGFAQLARREQRSTLDKQLASQAYYAAETGVNDVVEKINTKDATKKLNLKPNKKNECINMSNTGAAHNDMTPVISASASVSYSCILVDPEPPTLEKSGLKPGEGFNMTFGTKLPMKSLSIKWGSTTKAKPFRTTTPSGNSADFTPKESWNSPGVLQFSVTPIRNGNFDRASLLNNTHNAYLYPATSGTNSFDYNTGVDSQAMVYSGNCATSSTKYTCESTINFANGFGDDKTFLVHIINYYDDTNIQLSGMSVGHKVVSFTDGQAIVDVTGRAKDVLKRIQVRVPIKGNGDSKATRPDYTVEAGISCKRQKTRPTNTDFIEPPGISWNNADCDTSKL